MIRLYSRQNSVQYQYGIFITFMIWNYWALMYTVSEDSASNI